MEERTDKIYAYMLCIAFVIGVVGIILCGILCFLSMGDAVQCECARCRNDVAEFTAFDKVNYCYDADGPFVVIDYNKGIGAVYDGTRAIGHFSVEDKIRTTKEEVFDTPTLIIGGDTK